MLIPDKGKFKHKMLLVFLMLSFGVAQAFDKAPYDAVVDEIKAMWTKQDIGQVSFVSNFSLGTLKKAESLKVMAKIISEHPNLLQADLVRIDVDGEISTMLLNFHFEHTSIMASEVKLNGDFEIISLDVLDQLYFKKVASNRKQEQEKLSDLPFLSKSQLSQLYDLLISEIELNDAEGIATRNQTKAINWDSYIGIKRPAFITSSSWQELAAAFNSFGAGFVNLHAKFKFNSEIQTKLEKASLKLGFTYPEVVFFVNDDHQNDVLQLNGQNIKQVFQNYEDLNCRFSSEIGCLRAFTAAFNKGQIKIQHAQVHTLTTTEGSRFITYEVVADKPKSNTYYKPIDITGYDQWELLADGHKVALFKHHNSILLKIKNFIYSGNIGGDLRCAEPAAEKSLCYDVQLIRKVLDQVNPSQTNLIIDVQNNGGGNENSALLAELVNHPFEDLQVVYKNNEHLEKERLRSHLFYGSPNAEKWYQGLSQEQKSNPFLPPRADFCQGHEACKIQTIQPNIQRRFKHTFILTNERCVSSCDDFVWRMHEFGNAKVVGLPHATDATYSRLSIQFYLDKNGVIQLLHHGDGAKPKFEGVGLFNITIPYSKTVHSNGTLRAGKTATYEYIFPVTKENFSNHAINSVKKIFELLEN